MERNIAREKMRKPADSMVRSAPAFTRLISLLLALVFLAPSLSHAQEIKVFRMPFVAPASNEVPLHYSDSRRVTVFFKTTPEAIRKLVPKPLVPNPNNIMGIMACHWNAKGFQNLEFNDGGGKILEVALLTPVGLEEKRGAYIVMIYLDNASRIPMSREIWGFPKKLADVTFDESDKTFSSTVKINGTRILQLDFERTAKVEPVPPSQPSYVFNLKKIPSIRRDAPPEVLQITSTLTDFKVKEQWKGKAALKFGSLPMEPLGEIPVLKILAANESHIEGTMDYGDVLYDYIARGKK